MDARPAGFQTIAEGSFATATNASPMPTARAPTPIFRNDPEEVPARWLPRSNCASATPGPNRRSASANAEAAFLGSEVIVELESPRDAVAVVGRIVDGT